MSEPTSKSSDLKPGTFPEDLQWSADGAFASLENLYQFVNDECTRAVDWYYSKRGSKRLAGRVLRVNAIVALTVSGIIPVLAQIYRDSGLEPGWATATLATAALLMTLDRFGGHTSGWIRYIRTGQALSHLQSTFRIDWEAYRLSLKDNISAKDTERGIILCRKFLVKVHSTVASETDSWAEEFQKVVLELDQTVDNTKNGESRGQFDV